LQYSPFCRNEANTARFRIKANWTIITDLCAQLQYSVRPANSFVMLLPLQIEDSGALGELSFREDGRRQGYVIGIYGLTISGLVQVRQWLILHST